MGRGIVQVFELGLKASFPPVKNIIERTNIPRISLTEYGLRT